jgi:arginine decarboxylase
MWDRSPVQQSPGKEGHRAAVTKYFKELRQWEDYFAYPGQTLLKSLEERIASSDASGTPRLIQSMSAA